MKQKHFLFILIILGVGAVALLFSLISKQQSTVQTPALSVQATVTPGSPTSLANPASVNCGKQGGTLVIKKDGAGGEYGLCEFEDNMACEEWALMRGECPVGGIKTTGFDNIEQKYCAWRGGKTFAVENATCVLPSGKTCNDTSLYNETCS